jgi:hypothetical protein
MGRMGTALVLSATIIAAPARMTGQAGSDAVLDATAAQKLLPMSVYYCGQSAPTQVRNSGGVKFADGHYVLATLVDTSGYSSGITAKYQGYFIAEVPLEIEGQVLPAGVYGIGFIADHKFVVTDVGAHDVLTVNSSTDAAMRRPRPLQVLADPAGGFRLYAGRSYVSFHR